MDDWQVKETLARLIGWVFVPSFATQVLQTFWYKLKRHHDDNYDQNPDDQLKTKISATTAIPEKGSYKHTLHYNRIFCGVVLAYMIYSIVEVGQTLGPSHYDVLDLPFHSFSHRELKRSFRRASFQYHPDKVGATGTDAFIAIRAAHDVLIDPVLRHAYDRFGPSIFRCTQCLTTRDYLRTGITMMGTLYGISFSLLILMSVFGWATYGRYWRFVLLTAMCALEWTMVLNPYPLEAMTWLLPHRPTFQQITIMHQVFLAIAVASYKIGPIMSSLQEQKQNNTLQEKGKKTLLTTKGATLKEQLQRLEEISQVSNQESLQQLQSFFHSFNDDDESMILLREQLGVVALEAQLLRDPLYNRTQSTALLRLSSSPSSSSSLPPSAQEQLD